MFLKDKKVRIKITSYNINKFKSILNNGLIESGQQVEIDQALLPQNSTIKVWCECDTCGNLFLKKRSEIRNKTYCSKICRNKGNVNPNPPKEKYKVECNICHTPIFVNEAKFNKQEYFLCSRSCYSEHRSNVYKKENVYNYQDLRTCCENCNKEFKTTKYDEDSRRRSFCSQKCYWEYRKDHYQDLYFSERRNSARRETKPEKMVRNKFDEIGISYIQEYSIDNIYFADFYLESHNIIVEVYGDYWHANPNIYGKDKRKVNEMQKQKVKKDRIKEGYLRHKKYNLVILWERDIYNNLDSLIKSKILNRIDTQESATTTRQAPTKGEDIV